MVRWFIEETLKSTEIKIKRKEGKGGGQGRRETERVRRTGGGREKHHN